MKLLPKEVAEKIPQLYETESLEMYDKVAQVKLFAPMSNWAWYIMEYDGKDTCFGLVQGHVAEFGYFNISALEAIKKPLPVERDLHFTPTAVSKLLLQGMSGRG